MTYVPTSSANHQTEHADPRSAVFGHPDDVLKDRRLTADEKRCLLAAWACDTNAVPHIPSLRQLPDGSIVNVDEILDAMKALDASVEATSSRSGLRLLWRRPFERRRGSKLRNWTRFGRWPGDDDDDPPPCPAFAAVKPRAGGGAALAEPEILLA